MEGKGSRRVIHAAGRIFDSFITPVFDENGALESLIGIATDITERQQIEDALREERGLFVGGPVMVIRWQSTSPWLVDYISPNVQAILGYAPEDLISGRIRFDDLVHPDDRERIHREAQVLRTSGVGHYEQEYRIRNASGQYRWIHDFTAFANRDPDIRFYLGYMLDITERRQAEEALGQTQKLESLGLLAGGIAHDFNNLLTVVMGNLNLAQMHLPEGAKPAQYLAKMEATVLRATELTKQLLAYSGRGHFLVKPQDLNKVVDEVAHLLEVSISKKVHLHFDLDPELPAIQADAAQIQQVVMNLVTNASDAIGDQEGTIRLTTTTATLGEHELRQHFTGNARVPGRYVLLEVADSGCGIPDEVMARIFDPFFTTKAAGRGLGLSAMLGILRGHNAGMSIHSEVGQGSRFRICFPASESIPDEATQRWSEEAFRDLKAHVLLVDDEDLVLQTIGAALESLGLTVATARDGVEAVEAFRAATPRPDLVIMDLTMPRMDGREAFQAMHQLDASVPVLLSSGFTQQDSLETESGHGPAGFIQKPYQIKELRRMLQRLLKN
jgi:PAS domain S-box-containing protein